MFNFWATWCQPCVKELPVFETAYQEFRQKNIKIILINLDFKKDLETKLIPFINKKQISVPIVLLDETDYNLWIDKIEQSWQGNIPITFIVNNRKKYKQFINKELSLEELRQLLSPLY